MIYRYNVSAYFKIETDKDIEDWDSNKLLEYAINQGNFNEIDAELEEVVNE